jgi:hypothetical protein
MDKYRSGNETERAMEFAWTSAQQQLQLLQLRCCSRCNSGLIMPLRSALQVPVFVLL